VLEVNSFTGYASITGNFGDLQNKGVELSLQSRNIQQKDFSWNTIFNIAHNRNKITNLVLASPITTGWQKVTQSYLAGFPAFAVFAFDYAGLDNMGDPTIQLVDKSITKERNVTLPEDILYMGTYQPRWSGGLTNQFRYKGLTLTFNAIFNMGHVMRRDVGPFYNGNFTYAGRFTHRNLDFMSGNVHADFQNRWRQPGDEAFTMVPGYLSNQSQSLSRRDVLYYVRGDVNVINASFVKLRDVTLAYSLPARWIQRIRAEEISFRVQVSNIMLWKANKYGIDPEFQSAAVGTRFTRANQQSITLGAHISF
jgi:hypothetical protein